MKQAMQAGTVTVNEIEAYLARPLDTPVRGGVVVIHHAPGYDEGTKEIARRFATWGYAAVVPNLNHRIAPGAEPDDAAAAARAAGGKDDAELVTDVADAVAYLKTEGAAKVGVIGYCSGGRQTVLAACEVDLDAAVDCYGGHVITDSPPDSPLPRRSLRDKLPGLRAPLLGLFGNDDVAPGPDEVNNLDALLTELGKEHEFHRYEGAGHGFFSTNRAAYRVEAANDGYQRIKAFFAKHLES